MHKAVASVAVILLIGAACGRGDAALSRVVVTDSAGVMIVDNGTLDLTQDLLASPAPLLQIGVVSGDEAYQLYRVSDVKRLSDGGITVANGGTRDLRIYNADGSHRATAGGPGRGPSEFRYPSAVRTHAGDTIVVQDFMDRVYFTPAGEYIRRETTDRAKLSALMTASGGFSEGGSWTGDGTLFAPIYQRQTGPPTPGPLYRPRMTMVRVSADFTSVDTLGSYGGILQQFVDMGPGRGVSSIVPPYAADTNWALGAADGTIVIGDNASPQVDRFMPNGSRMIIRWAAATEPITPAEVEAWKDVQRNAEWTQGQLPALERGWAAMDIPATKAFYGGVAAGSDGTVWVTTQDEGAGTATLLAFRPDGHYAGTITVPGRFVARDSGPGWVLGVTRDENDVEFVQVFGLRTGPT